MGIDPKNHRLNQIPLRPQPKSVSEAATSSSESMNHESKPLISLGNTDRVSDAASSLEDEMCGSLDLNLDLTIAFPSPPVALVEEKRQSSKTSTRAEQMESDQPVPTLFLF